MRLDDWFLTADVGCRRAAPLVEEHLAARFVDLSHELRVLDRARAHPATPAPNEPERVSGRERWWSHAFHRLFVDPDGRPRRLRRAEEI